MHVGVQCRSERGRDWMELLRRMGNWWPLLEDQDSIVEESLWGGGREGGVKGGEERRGGWKRRGGSCLWSLQLCDPNFMITAEWEVEPQLLCFPSLPPTALLPPSLDACSDGLSREVRLDFTRTMNHILFDKTVTSQPGTLPFVTLPDPHAEVVPQRGELAGVRFTN